jgi:hypothetical protein
MDVQNQPSGLPNSPALPVSASGASGNAACAKSACGCGAGRLLAVLGCLAACALLAGGAYWMTRDSVPNGTAGDGVTQNGAGQDGTPPHSEYAVSPINSAQMFAGWNNPDFVLCLTSQTHGYLQPCGCSDPQYGGLARRWQLFETLTQKGWTLVPIDGGEITPTDSSTPYEQNLLKYQTAMRSLGAMGYQAVGLGRDELKTGLTELLPQFALNNKRPRHIALNLDGNPQGIFTEMGVAHYEIAQAGKSPRIGVVGLLGARTVDEFKADPQYKFPRAVELLAPALKALAGKSDFNVVLFQGLDDEAAKCAEWVAQERAKDATLAPVHLILHNNTDPEPPGVLREAAGAQLVTVGHKGKYVGVLGAWKNRGGYEFKYQLVAVGPEFAPKPGNPVLPIMQDYAQTVKDRNLAAKFLFGPHKTQRAVQGAKYVGSEICANCHNHAYKIWSESKHEHAFATLRDYAKDPSLREFDGECLKCHTVGFRHDTGYNDPRVNARTKDLLKAVGCESCHGPASMHVNNSNNEKFYPLINEFAAKHNPRVPENIRLRRLDDFCMGCHDIDNDVHWSFQKRWADVIHMTPKK